MDLLVVGGGLIFLGVAWWMRTHEFWSTQDARELWERNPSALRRVNYRVEVVVSTVIVPLALAILGIACVISGLTP